MGTIASWLNDRYQAKEVNLIVEDTHAQLKTTDELLAKYFPVKEYDDRNFLGLIVSKVEPIASVIGYNGKAPASRPNYLRQAVSQLIKLGITAEFDEETQFRMEEMVRYARLSNQSLQDRIMPDGQVKEGYNNSLANLIYQQPKNLVKGIHNLLRLFTWQIITTGAIDHTDLKTNIRTQLDWKDPDANYNHFPAALTNTGSGHPLGTVVWSDYENADGITTLENDILTYYNTNGYFPDEIVMSLELAMNLARQQAVIDRAKGYNLFRSTQSVGIGTVKEIIKLDMLTDVEISVYDQRYDLYEGNDGAVPHVRFLPTNRFCFLKKNMGERCLGTTIESKNGLYDKPKKGIFVETKADPLDETKDLIKAKATGLAICLNPKVLWSRQVMA